MKTGKKAVRIAGALVWLSLLCVCYFQMRCGAGALDECRQKTMILLEQAPLSVRQAQAMRELEEEGEAPVRFAAWRQKNERQAENPDLQRSCTVSVVEVCGGSDLVLAGSARLDEQDREGCLIGEKTAQTLFGNANAAGQKITVDGEEKIVRGLLYRAEDAVLVQAGAQEGTAEEKFTAVFAELPEGSSPESFRQSFVLRHGIQGRTVGMDRLSFAADVLCILVPALAAFWLIGGCVRAAKKEKEGRAFFLAGCAVLLALFFAWALGQIRVSPDMLPTRWSDFAFWKELLGRERETWLLLFLAEKQKPIQPYMGAFARTLACGLLSAVCILRLRDILLAFFGKMLL